MSENRNDSVKNVQENDNLFAVGVNAFAIGAIFSLLGFSFNHSMRVSAEKCAEGAVYSQGACPDVDK